MNYNRRSSERKGRSEALLQADLFKVIVLNIAPTHPEFASITEEALWARRLNDGTFQIDNVPLFATGFSYGDIVRVQSSGGSLYVRDVIGRSGRSTYRVFVNDPLDDDQHGDYHAMLSMLEYLGVTVEAATATFFAIDVPPGVPVQAVYDVLELGLERKIWDFDEGFYAGPTDSSSGVTPQ